MDSKQKALYLISPLKEGVYWKISQDEYWGMQKDFEWLSDHGYVTAKRDIDLRISEVAITKKGLDFLGRN